MIDTKEFYDYLGKKGMDFFAGVPDSLLKNLCACIKENSPKSNNIITANEGNAVAIAAGRFLSTNKIGVVYMQNSGLGNIVNPLLSLIDPAVYNIPELFIIGYRGEPGVHDEPQHVKQGELTLPLLETLGVKWEILGEHYQQQIDRAYSYMRTTDRPYALVVRKGLFKEYKLTKADNDFPMTREESLKEIIAAIDPEDFIVSTTGKTSREIFEIREARNEGHGHDFLTVGSMGHTSSIALGMSLGTDKNVYCIDGDGSFIMPMGASAIVAQNQGYNLRYILLNNGAHESVGGQPTVALDINTKKILEAVGFPKVYESKTKEELLANMKKLRASIGSAMIVYTHQGSRADLGRPTTTPVENKEAIMRNLTKK